MTENFSVGDNRDSEYRLIVVRSGGLLSIVCPVARNAGNACGTCRRCGKRDDEVDRGIVAGTNPPARGKREIAKDGKRRRDACHVTNVLLMRCKPVILTSHHEVTRGRRRLLQRAPRRVFSEREAAVT